MYLCFEVSEPVPEQNPPLLSQEQLEFLKTIESKLKKAEKETWLVHSPARDHLIDK